MNWITEFLNKPEVAAHIRNNPILARNVIITVNRPLFELMALSANGNDPLPWEFIYNSADFYGIREWYRAINTLNAYLWNFLNLQHDKEIYHENNS